MNTTQHTQSLPATTLKSTTLRAAGRFTTSLNHLLQQYGPDLDATAVHTEIAALDDFLVNNIDPGAHNDYVDQLDADRAPAGVAAVALAKRLGAPISDIETPHDPPKLERKRHMHDIEVLSYRHFAVTHNARAAAVLGALEQGATTRELGSLKPTAAIQGPDGLALDLPGTASKQDGHITLPPWAQVTYNELNALRSAGGKWLLTDSKSQSDDGRNSAVLMFAGWVLEEALHWTRPSPAAVTHTAAHRAYDRDGLEAAHLLLRNNNIDNSAKVLGL